MTGVLTGLGAGMIALGGVWKLLRGFDWGSVFSAGDNDMMFRGLSLALMGGSNRPIQS